MAWKQFVVIVVHEFSFFLLTRCKVCEGKDVVLERFFRRCLVSWSY